MNHTSVPEELQGWGDQPDDKTPDYEEQIFWDTVDSDSDSEHSQVSSATARVMQEAFSQALSSQRRKTIKGKQPIPDTPHTKFPKLDPTIQSRMSPGTKAVDRNLAGLQGFVLDVAIPLVNMMESARSGSRDAAESAQKALKLLGNASAHISVERRLKASS